MAWRDWSKLEYSAILLAILTAWLLTISVPAAWDEGYVAVFSVTFGLVTAFLALHGIFVLWSVRRQGRIRYRRLLLWLAAISLLMAVVTLLVVYLGQGTLVLELGISIYSLEWAAFGLIILWLLFFLISWLLVAAACSAIWMLSKLLRAILPPFLVEVRAVRFDGNDSLMQRAALWLLDFPTVLDPSSLSLEARSMDNRAARDRFFEALQWQLALGLLLGVYVSLNPVLLQTMSFTQTLTLVSLSSIVVPLLILPWSTLDALGVKAKGVRKDFYLNHGAKRRMRQTLLALGTLFIILRLAIESIGVEEIAWRFTGYVVTLFLLSALVSFAYFNFFEERLIADVRSRLEERGF